MNKTYTKRGKEVKITYSDWWRLLTRMKSLDLCFNYEIEFKDYEVVVHDNRKLKNVKYDDYYRYKNPLDLIKL